MTGSDAPRDRASGPVAPYADGTPYGLTQVHRVDSHVGRRPDGRRGFVDWMFRSRTTGRITVAQFPNAAILVWLGASLLQRVWDPVLAGHAVLAWVSTGALVVWAVDELARGVNPFRRMLGAGVLLATAWSLLR